MTKLWLLWLKISRPFRRTFTANICGHRTKTSAEITSHGETYIQTVPLSENGKPDYCPECIGKMAIKCAWCENQICIGDPVTLYIPEESHKLSEHAVRYEEDPRCVVGCLGWKCAFTGADRQGFWYPPGKVHRVPSPIEMLMSGVESGKKDAVVLVGDLSNPNDLGKVI